MTNNLTDSTNPNRELFARLYAHIDFSTDKMLEEEEYSSNKDLVSYANGIKGLLLQALVDHHARHVVGLDLDRQEDWSCQNWKDFREFLGFMWEHTDGHGLPDSLTADLVMEHCHENH